MIRLLTSGLVIFGVLAAVAGVSNALFSDTAELENSTFATGNVDLAIASNAGSVPGTYQSSVAGPSITGLMPGQKSTFVFWLRNQSSASVSLDLAALVNDIQGDTGAIRDDLNVGFTCDVGNDGSTPNDGSVAAKSLTAWAADSTPDGGLGTLGPTDLTNNGTGTDESRCVMTATLATASTASNKSVNFDSEFTGTQVAP